MSTKNDGGPAFARSATFYPVDSDLLECAAQSGMSLRDYFAGRAMQSLVAELHLQDIFISKICQRAYEYADAMLKARES